ncbi:DUF4407 domain-containing protein [Winogradskyella aquimaris]|nr:DUF4407 domain-containing protein [Winogradskyella aquimaris]
MFKNWWIRLGCFLCGYNYSLLKSCSEASKKAVKKYTAALLIVMMLWALIGFLFTKEYLKFGDFGSSIAAIIMVIIIVQVERQIILGTKNTYSKWFRVIIGFIMAVLGSVIVDQIIFREDIEKQKLFTVANEVNRLLPQRTKEINDQIHALDSILNGKELERILLIEEITQNPTIKIPSSTTSLVPERIETKQIIDGQEVTVYKDTTYVKKSFTTKSMTNPKVEFIPTINEQIEKIRYNRSELSKQLIDVRKGLRAELLEKKGFLDELKVMFQILVSSKISMGVWILWFIFFLAIELFVLVSKYGDKENDYDKMIEHQKDVRIKSIEALIS